MADRPLPPKPPPMPVLREGKPQRAQTSDDRGAAALKRRAQSPIPEPVADWDSLTDRYEGEELKRRRRQRDTDERIDRLEDKHDHLDDKLDKLGEVVGDVRADQREHGAMISTVKESLDRLIDDKDHATKTKRERITKVIGLLTSGGFVVEILHRLGWL